MVIIEKCIVIKGGNFRMLQKYMRRPELIILGIILVIGLIFRLMTLKHMVVI